MIGIGIVGLPNVGKSTLFNAITKTQNAEAANYPFATIEPNVGLVSVPDVRLKELEKVVNPQRTLGATVEFVDIAGLVKGASKGEGLGNQFLSNIRNTAAICQVVRCFDDDNIIHVEGSVDPIRDIETINTELIFADIDTVERALQRGENTIQLSDDGIYDAITQRKADLEGKVDAMNKLSSVTIVTNILGNKESLTGEQLQEMVTGVNASGLSFDEEKLLAYAQSLENKYGNLGNTVSFHSASGKDIAMNTPYGLHINVAAERDALRAAIASLQSQEREPVYAYRPAQYAQPQFGNTFLEIDLGLQHVYYYENGALTWESPTVTGMLTEDRATPSGVFFLKGKETNRTLKGKMVDGKPEYEAPVSYWMPFNGNIGLHDATWRSKFGGNIYVNNGSHGCINLPKNKAAELFAKILKNLSQAVKSTKFDENELNEMLDEIISECEYQETFWHATPFALVFLVRIYKSALDEKGEVAKFISRKLEEFFKLMLEICEKVEQMEHAKPLAKMADMLEPKYLDIVDQDELNYDDRLFYSFYYYSSVVLQGSLVKI